MFKFGSDLSSRAIAAASSALDAIRTFPSNLVVNNIDMKGVFDSLPQPQSQPQGSDEKQQQERKRELQEQSREQQKELQRQKDELAELGSKYFQQEGLLGNNAQMKELCG